MKVAGVFSIISSVFMFLSSIPMMLADTSTDLYMVYVSSFFTSIYLLINGIAMLKAAKKIHSMQRKITYLSGAIRTGYDRED